MLRTLLESQAVARLVARVEHSISVGVHTAAIALAIVATARATSAPPRPDEPKAPPVIFTQPVAAPPTHHCTARWLDPDAWCFYEALLPPLRIPQELPPIDGSQRPNRCAFDRLGERSLWAHRQQATARAIRRMASTGPLKSRRRRFRDRAIRRPCIRLALRSAQIEGSVVARFVVDTTGLAEPASITFPEATHAQFAEAVRQSLVHSRYLPAVFADRRVRQLVEQRFAFTLTR